MKVINILQEINSETSKDILEQIFDITKQNIDLQQNNQLLAEEMRETPEEILVNICCPGGDVYSGFAIVDALQNTGSTIITQAYGMVASMGLAIFLAGDVRIAGENTRFLYHGCSGGVEGTVVDTRQALMEQDRVNQQYKDFMKKQGVQMEDKLLDKFLESGTDFSFGYEEAVKYNIITEN